MLNTIPKSDVYQSIQSNWFCVNIIIQGIKDCVKCKIQKNWCTVTAAPTKEHHGGHSRKPEVRPSAREESASPAWLAAPAMNVCDTTKVYIYLTLYVDRHYIGSVIATTHKEKGIITLESNLSRETVLPAQHGKRSTCVKKYKIQKNWCNVTVEPKSMDLTNIQR